MEQEVLIRLAVLQVQVVEAVAVSMVTMVVTLVAVAPAQTLLYQV
jgi:hypothetical protein